jgi:hypothetical protein
MSIYETIIATYTELTAEDFLPHSGSILLADDGDGIVYLAKWEYSQPLPEGLKVGK